MSNLTKYLTLMSRYSDSADVTLMLEPQQAFYQTVGEYLHVVSLSSPDDEPAEGWLSEEDREKAINSNRLVEIVWHTTSVGFYSLYASSLETMEENIRQLLVSLKLIEG